MTALGQNLKANYERMFSALQPPRKSRHYATTRYVLRAQHRLMHRSKEQSLLDHLELRTGGPPEHRHRQKIVFCRAGKNAR